MYRQLCICAADKVAKVAAFVGMLGGGVRASWHADQVQAQRAQHDPGCALQRLLLQSLLVRAFPLRGRAGRLGVSQPLHSRCTAQKQAQTWDEQRL